MLAIALDGPDLRDFMNKLLAGGTFGGFCFREALVVSFARFEAEGQTGREDSVLPSWDDMRPYIFSLIKGREKPKAMRVVLSWPEDGLSEIDPNASALFLNINFEDGGALITTGCSTKNFGLDKDAENNWDAFVRDFLTRNGIKTGD